MKKNKPTRRIITKGRREGFRNLQRQTSNMREAHRTKRKESQIWYKSDQDNQDQEEDPGSIGEINDDIWSNHLGTSNGHTPQRNRGNKHNSTRRITE